MQISGADSHYAAIQFQFNVDGAKDDKLARQQETENVAAVQQQAEQSKQTRLATKQHDHKDALGSLGGGENNRQSGGVSSTDPFSSNKVASDPDHDHDAAGEAQESRLQEQQEQAKFFNSAGQIAAQKPEPRAVDVFA